MCSWRNVHPRMSLEPGDTLQVSNIVSLMNAHAGGRRSSPLYIEGSDTDTIYL